MQAWCIAHAHNFGALLYAIVGGACNFQIFEHLFEKMSSSLQPSKVSLPPIEALIRLLFMYERSFIIRGRCLQKRRLTYLLRDGENKENQAPVSTKPSGKRKDEAEGGNRNPGKLRQQKSSSKLDLILALLFNLCFGF